MLLSVELECHYVTIGLKSHATYGFGGLIPHSSWSLWYSLYWILEPSGLSPSRLLMIIGSSVVSLRSHPQEGYPMHLQYSS